MIKHFANCNSFKSLLFFVMSSHDLEKYQAVAEEAALKAGQIMKDAIAAGRDRRVITEKGSARHRSAD